MRTEILLTVADPRTVGSSEMTGWLDASPTRWCVLARAPSRGSWVSASVT